MERAEPQKHQTSITQRIAEAVICLLLAGYGVFTMVQFVSYAVFG